MYLLYVFLFMNMDTKYDFTSKKEFVNHWNENKLAIRKLEKISNKNVVFIYDLITREIIEFDYRINKGRFYTYDNLRSKLLKKNVDLRIILSEIWGGIHVSRYNYINEKNTIEHLSLDDVKTYLEKAKTLPYLKGLNDLNTFDFITLEKHLNNIEEAKVMEYEIPLLMAYLNYAVVNFKNKWRIYEAQNQFKESYFTVELQINNQPTWLGSSIFTSLFPDFERDDYERIEDVKIDVKGVKDVIDLYNRVNFEYIHD